MIAPLFLARCIMSRIKRYMEQLEEEQQRGYSLPSEEKYICGHHFHDKYLNKYIKSQGQDGVCSYCQKHDVVLEMSDFISYIGDELSTYLGNIDNENLYLASSFYDDEEEEIPGIKRYGPYAVPDDKTIYEDAREVMEDFNIISDSEEINNDIEKCLHVNNWIKRDPFGIELHEELSLNWKEFCRLVQNSQRFTFFKSPLFEDASTKGDHGLSDILTELGSMMSLLGKDLPFGEIIYRCRPENTDNPVTTFEDITSAPSHLAKANRMSPTGISMFYGSFDKTTPIKEILGYSSENVPKYIYEGTFQVIKPLHVVDLYSIDSSFWMPHSQEYLFLDRFHNEISKSANSKNPEIDYIPFHLKSSRSIYDISAKIEMVEIMMELFSKVSKQGEQTLSFFMITKQVQMYYHWFPLT